MLETLREYALERLAEAGETDTQRQRHATYYLTLAETAAPQLVGPEAAAWLGRLEAEQSNLRAALDWVLTTDQAGAITLGLRLAGALWRFWYAHSYLREGRQVLEALLARDLEGADPALRARALYGASVLANEQLDLASTTALAEESLALYRRLDDERGMASALNILGTVAQNSGDYARARALHEESLVLARKSGHSWAVARVISNMGIGALYAGDYARAATHYEESLALFREGRDEWGVAMALTNLAEALQYQGQRERATALFRESLGMHQRFGHKLGVAECLEGLAMGLAPASPARVATLCGAAAALREAVAAPRPAPNRAPYERVVAAARLALAEDGFAAAWATGRALTLDQAVAMALDQSPES
jgi:non-specific serine/threonine protein kinase